MEFLKIVLTCLVLIQSVFVIFNTISLAKTDMKIHKLESKILDPYSLDKEDFDKSLKYLKDKKRDIQFNLIINILLFLVVAK